MTTLQWAEVLAGLSDPAEVRDCLLMLADEMPDGEAHEVRSFARRAEGLMPWHSARTEILKGPSWAWFVCTDEALGPADYEGSGIPTAMRDLLKMPDGACHDHLWGRYFPTPQQAWLSLLEALPAYARAKVTA